MLSFNQDSFEFEHSLGSVNNTEESKQLLLQLNNLLESDEPKAPTWVKQYLAESSYSSATFADFKTKIRHIALPSAFDYFKEIKKILKFNKPKPENNDDSLSITAEHRLPIHTGPVYVSDNKLVSKFFKKVSDGSTGKLTIRVCNMQYDT